MSKKDTVKTAKTDTPAKVKKEKKPTDKLADKSAMTKFLQGIFGDAQKKTLKRLLLDLKNKLKLKRKLY